tara:strand:+ start:8293 stop:9540 length:1248 start_codon:yes stop_codon:yes gene_type:complete
MTKKLLIISYFFNSPKNIGGRRWSKFYKYLVKKNVDLRVLTSSSNEDIKYDKDLIKLKDKIDFVNFKYPKYLGVNPSNFIEKILYRLNLIYSKLTTNKNFYDKSVHGKINLLKKVELYIKMGYNNVVVTIAPFHLATYISEIIHKYPKVNFIVDFRDPWVDNRTSYGYTSLSKRRRKIEDSSEKKVIESYNHVVTVSSYMTNSFKQKYPSSNAVFSTIPNGFDADDYLKYLNVNGSSNSPEIKLVFSGTFYNSAKKHLSLINKWLCEIKIFDIELYNLIVIDFFGNMAIHHKIFENHNRVNFHGFKNKTVVYEMVQKSDACLLFLTDDINYSFSTKFCDYIALKKPILVFSKKGLTSNYIKENKIGHSLNEDCNAQTFVKYLEHLKNNPSEYYFNYSSEKFNLEYLTNDYLNILL